MSILSQKEIRQHFEAHYHRLYLFARKLVNESELAHDMVQDSFVVLMNSNLRNFNDPTIIKSFLYSTIKNIALKYYRKNKSEADYLAKQNNPIQEEASIYAKLFESEYISELYLALEKLPQGCREICKLSYLEGLKHQDIADQLGISINTVKTQKQRALKLLRNKLSPYAYFLIFF